MKSLVIVLAVLFFVLQYKLWFDSEGISEVWHLKENIAKQTSENQMLAQRNAALSAEVQDLKKGTTAVEERARNDLGMTKPDETYYQIVNK